MSVPSGKHALTTTSSARRDCRWLIWLGIAGIFSVAVYAIIFTRTAFLFNLISTPKYDLRLMVQADPALLWLYRAAFLILACTYALGAWAASKIGGKAAWAILIVTAMLSIAALILVYPFDASDIFDYIMHGRMLALFGANPYLQTPSGFTQDPIFPYVGWTKSTSPYGPLFVEFSSITALLAGNSVAGNVIAFKLMNGLFYLAAAAFLVAILRRQDPARALQGAWLFALNPLVLYETFGHGHNDITLAASLIASVWFMTGKRYTLSLLSLIVGALFKHVTLMVVPLAIVLPLLKLKPGQARIKFLLTAGSSSLVLIVLAYFPLWVGWDTIDLSLRMYLYTTSLPTIIHTQLRDLVNITILSRMVSGAAAGLTVLAAGFFAWRASRDDDWTSYPRAALGTLLFYLLVTCLWFQQWYAVWLISLAAVLPLGGLSILALLFSFTVMTKVLVFAPPLLWARPLPATAFREFWLTVGVMGIPWIVAIILLLNKVRTILRLRRVGK